MRTLYHRAGNNGTVLEHILEIYEIAVVHMLSIVIRIVKVDYTLFVRLHYILGEKYAVCDIAADLARHIVALNAVNSWVLVCILLLCLFVMAFDKAENSVIRRI